MILKIKLWLFSILLISNAFSQSPYWQQEVNYKINVSLDDTLHELTGDIAIEYQNNSPETLNFIYFHLWPNAYKNHTTAFAKQQLENGSTTFYFSDAEEKGWIKRIKFRVNGDSAKWAYDTANIDIAKLYLNKPLKPGEKILITTPFRVKIPKTFSRFGHEDQAYQITQWYPKPAVYDHKGWHPMPYLDQGEFYSEFGSFDVNITLPKNYVVGATGNLQNESEIQWLNEKAAETAKIETFPLSDSFPPSDKELKTLNYKAENVHDFAWFADKRFNVLKGEVVLPNTKRKVTTWAMFPNHEAKFWKKSIQYLNDGIYYYSLWIGDYSYEHATAVHGALVAGGGMEYPQITVIGNTGNAKALETVIVHEIGHNWFQGILASNEREHPWMDEGINSYYENRYTELKSSGKLLGEKSNSGIARLFDLGGLESNTQSELLYLMAARKNLDQTIDIHSADYTEMNYGGIVYGKTSLIFNYLKNYIGEAEFDKLMQQYFEQWKFKHPYPEDLKKILDQTGKNLDWLWIDEMHTTKKINYSIKGIGETNQIGKTTFQKITIKNNGEIKAPFSISAMRNDSVIETQWIDGFLGEMEIMAPFGNHDGYRIDAEHNIPESNRKNNTIRTSGILKKTEPLRMQFLSSLENPYKTQVFFSPIIGWNNYDKLMVGMAFYNITLPSKKFEYAIAPMYGTASKTLTGLAKADYYIYPNKLFQNIKVGVNAWRFSAYETYLAKDGTRFNEGTLPLNKIKPSITFELKNKTLRQKQKNTVSIAHFNISAKECTDREGIYCSSRFNTNYYVNALKFEHQNNKALTPYNVNFNIHQSENFVKAFAESNNKFSYGKKNKGLSLRGFAGAFLSDKMDPFTDELFNYSLSGKRGYQDYLLEEVYLGRTESEGGLSRQLTSTDGLFKFAPPVSLDASLLNSDKWLIAFNVKTTLPGKLPLAIFFDAASYASTTVKINEGILFEAGISLIIIPDVAEVHLPLLFSPELNQNLKLYYSNVWDRITFTLNLSKLEPFKLIRNLSL